MSTSRSPRDGARAGRGPGAGPHDGPACGGVVPDGELRGRGAHGRGGQEGGRPRRGLPQPIARAWLGRELPDWNAPCPVRVKLTGGEAGGVTTFDFNPGGVPTSA